MAKTVEVLAPARSARVRRRPWRNLGDYLFVAPAAVFLLALLVYPVLFNVQMSFRDVQASNLLRGDAPAVGLANYRAVFADPLLGLAARNSLVFTALSILFQVGLGLALAVFYNRRFPGARVMRTLYLVAWTVPLVVSGTVFRWLLDGQYGVVNWVLRGLGLLGENVFWLTEPSLALYAVVFVNVWIGLPFNLTLLLAALQGIPADLYEAADIDGANGPAKFRFITLPILTPALLSVLVLGLIATLKVFDLVFITTRGGPANATQVVPTLAYKLVFEQFRFGEGAAVLNLLFVVLFVLSLGYLWTVRREEAR